MTRLLFLFLASLAAYLKTYGQQLPYQTQFRQLHGYINPASVSSDYFLYEYNTSFNASYRLQWAAQNQTPRTFLIGGDYIHDNRHRGAGFNLTTGAHLLRDRVGPYSLTGAYTRLAGLFAEDPYFGALSLGFGLGITEYRLQYNRIVWETLDDNLIPLNDIRVIKPEIGVGLFYYKRFKKARISGDNIYAGLSVPQLWAANTEVESQGNRVPVTRIPHLFMTGGWYHFFNEESFLELGFWAKYAAGTPINVHLIARFQPIRTFWAGAGFNPNGLVHLETGFNLPGFISENANLKIGYAFDYNITAFDLPLGTSHELHLSWMFDTK